MTEDGTKSLTPAQRKAVEALLTAGSAAEAAASAGVSRRTLYRWMQEDVTFQAAMREAEQEAVEGLSRTLAGLGELAGSALRDALAGHQKITVRLRASEIVIGNLLRIRELVELEQRIAALEQHSNENT